MQNLVPNTSIVETFKAKSLLLARIIYSVGNFQCLSDNSNSLPVYLFKLATPLLLIVL